MAPEVASRSLTCTVREPREKRATEPLRGGYESRRSDDSKRAHEEARWRQTARWSRKRPVSAPCGTPSRAEARGRGPTVARAGRPAGEGAGRSHVAPHPIANFGHVLEVGAAVELVASQGGPALLDQCGGLGERPAGATERFDAEVVATHAVQDHHVERRSRGALLVEPADVEPRGVRTAVDDLVDRPLVAVEREDDVDVAGEE